VGAIAFFSKFACISIVLCGPRQETRRIDSQSSFFDAARSLRHSPERLVPETEKETEKAQPLPDEGLPAACFGEKSLIVPERPTYYVPRAYTV